MWQAIFLGSRSYLSTACWRQVRQVIEAGLRSMAFHPKEVKRRVRGPASRSATARPRPCAPCRARSCTVPPASRRAMASSQQRHMSGPRAWSHCSCAFPPRRSGRPGRAGQPARPLIRGRAAARSRAHARRRGRPRGRARAAQGRRRRRRGGRPGAGADVRARPRARARGRRRPARRAQVRACQLRRAQARGAAVGARGRLGACRRPQGKAGSLDQSSCPCACYERGGVLKKPRRLPAGVRGRQGGARRRGRQPRRRPEALR